jgi:coenzyme PQQ synthesis protein D (PqqD)
MDGENVFRFGDGVRFFNFDEDSFVIDTKDLSLYNLGMSSALISAHLDGKNSLKEIMEAVGKRYDAAPEDSEAAVAKFIEMMHQKNLIIKIN